MITGLLFLLLGFVAVSAVIIAPLYALMHYAAMIDPRYETWSKVLGVLTIHKLDEIKPNEVTGRGWLLLLALPATPIGFYLLLTGESLAGALVTLCCVAVWAGLLFEDRYKSVPVAKLRQYAGKIEVQCTSCSDPVYVDPGRKSQAICRNGHSFLAMTTDRKMPAWTIAGVLAALWILIARPWAGGFSPPEWVFGASLLVYLLSWLIQFIADLRRQETLARKIDFAALEDLRLIVAITMVTSMLVFGLNRYVASATNPARRDLTINWVQSALGSVDRFLEVNKEWHVALMLTIATLVIGVLLLRAGRADAFKRAVATQKAASKSLKYLTTSAIVLSSFSLTGATEIGTTAGIAQFGLSSLKQEADRKLNEYARAVDRVVLVAPTAAALDNDPAWRSTCGPLKNPAPCSAQMVSSIDDQVSRYAVMLASWPGRSDTAFARKFFSAAGVTAREANVFSILSSKAGQSATAGLPKLYNPAQDDVGDSTLGQLSVAVDAIKIAADADVPQAQQEKEAAGSAVDMLFGFVDFGPDELVKAHFGELSGKLAGTVVESVKKQLKDSIRDGLLSVVRACQIGSSACRAAASERMIRFRQQAASSSSVARFAHQAAAVADRGALISVTLLKRNDATEQQLADLKLPAVKGEQKDSWHNVLEKLKASSKSSEVSLFFESDLESEWQKRVGEIAVKLGVDGKSKTAPEGGWDKALLSFLREDPTRVGTFASMMQAAASDLQSDDANPGRRYLDFAKSVTGRNQDDPNDVAILKAAEVGGAMTQGGSGTPPFGEEFPKLPRSPKMQESILKK